MRGILLGLLLIFGSQGLWAQQESERPEIEFSVEGGFYDDSLSVVLFSPGATVFYTLDGRMPSQKSHRYTHPIFVKSNTVIRAIAYKHGKKSYVTSHTYLLREPPTDLMVVSLAINPTSLFDPQEGLFMTGNIQDTTWKKLDANFWSRQELQANVELFEPNGNCVYRNNSGFRLFGGMSRLFPQKSMTIVARNHFGKSRFDYPVFGPEHPKKYKFLVLRNSGSDFGKSHFRDALMTGLVDDWDIEKQAYRPAHIYINGDYWGIYNIREKVNRYFLADHNLIDKDSIDMLEHRYTRKRGSKLGYKALLQYLETHNLRDISNFAYVESQMDVENFMNYQIAQIYFDNQDAGGNIKYWRPQTPDGRWRWILYDTDWGMGLHDKNAHQNNSLKFHTEPNGPSWPNPAWSTFILRKLLENRSFKQRFINRFLDHLNTTFREDVVLDKIDEIYQTLEPEMDRHLKRWRLSKSTWEREVRYLREFARKRPRYLRKYLAEFFALDDMRTLTVNSSPGGQVEINYQVEVREDGFRGLYAGDVPLNIKAVAQNGFRFSHWEGDLDDKLRNLTLRLPQQHMQLKAVFEKFVHPLADEIVINEVSPNSKPAGDWVEIHNTTKETVWLTDWILADANHHEFRFPEVSIPPNDYLVVCEDLQKFRQRFPRSYNAIGDLDFGLNKRMETIALYAPQGATIDNFSYSLPPSDSIFTLNLLLPTLDNSDLENWEIRNGLGTPNSANPYYVESRIRGIQNQWIQIGIAAGALIICIMLLVLRFRGYF